MPQYKRTGGNLSIVPCFVRVPCETRTEKKTEVFVNSVVHLFKQLESSGMHVSKILVFSFVCSLLCLLAMNVHAKGNNGAGSFPELRALANTAQDMNKRLAHMESLLETMVRPVWEYKVVVPNTMNTSNMDEHVMDGIDINKLGKEGWELVNYTDNYGFIFKRRHMEK